MEHRRVLDWVMALDMYNALNFHEWRTSLGKYAKVQPQHSEPSLALCIKVDCIYNPPPTEEEWISSILPAYVTSHGKIPTGKNEMAGCASFLKAVEKIRAHCEKDDAKFQSPDQQLFACFGPFILPKGKKRCTSSQPQPQSHHHHQHQPFQRTQNQLQGQHPFPNPWDPTLAVPGQNQQSRQPLPAYHKEPALADQPGTSGDYQQPSKVRPNQGRRIPHASLGRLPRGYPLLLSPQGNGQPVHGHQDAVRSGNQPTDDKIAAPQGANPWNADEFLRSCEQTLATMPDLDPSMWGEDINEIIKEVATEQLAAERFAPERVAPERVTSESPNSGLELDTTERPSTGRGSSSSSTKRDAERRALAEAFPNGHIPIPNGPNHAKRLECAFHALSDSLRVQNTGSPTWSTPDLEALWARPDVVARRVRDLSRNLNSLVEEQIALLLLIVGEVMGQCLQLGVVKSDGDVYIRFPKQNCNRTIWIYHNVNHWEGLGHPKPRDDSAKRRASVEGQPREERSSKRQREF